MPLKTGTLDISSLYDVQNQQIAQVGEDRIAEILNAELDVHNEIVNDLMSELCTITTERLYRYGVGDAGEMVEVDEYGRAPTQKPAAGATVGAPLRMFQHAVGWTRKYMQRRTVNDVLQTFAAAQKAHLKRLGREIKNAIFGATNYTFQDFLVDKVDLNVKRFLNADSSAIPEGPNGEVFDGTTHTHYDAIAALDAPSLKATVRDVVEHGHGEGVRIIISQADESAVRALTGFKEYLDARIIRGGGATTDVAQGNLDNSRLDNRAIGIFEGAEVWTKPWGIEDYAFVYAAGDARKPLTMRVSDIAGTTGLRIAADIDTFPLRAQYMEAELGVAVRERTNGAVLYFAGGAYVVPTIS